MDTNVFAHRLERLFEEKKKPNGRRYTPTEVLEGTNGSLTRVYLWKLRNGHQSNPSFRVIQALADFFEIDPSYFFQRDQSKVTEMFDRQNDLACQIEDRVARLDPEGQKALLFMAEAIIESKKERSLEHTMS
jgi:transcriptional regulator with XRE-family HTH domain